MQSSPLWMMKDMSMLQGELWSWVETGSQYYFTWFVVFFCCSDKVGLRLVSLQQAHALSMTLPERGRGRQWRRGSDSHTKDTRYRWTASVWDQAECMARVANELWIWVNLGQIVPTGRGFLWIIHSVGGLIIYPPPASPCFSDLSPHFYYLLTLIIAHCLSPIMPISPFVLAGTLFVYV